MAMSFICYFISETCLYCVTGCGTNRCFREASCVRQSSGRRRGGESFDCEAHSEAAGEFVEFVAAGLCT